MKTPLHERPLLLLLEAASKPSRYVPLVWYGTTWSRGLVRRMMDCKKWGRRKA